MNRQARCAPVGCNCCECQGKMCLIDHPGHWCGNRPFWECPVCGKHILECGGECTEVEDAKGME